MRTVSAQWDANQLEDAAAPSVIIGYVETREETEGEPDVVRWDIDNTTANNVVEAEVTHEFDYSRTTLPLDSGRVQIENGVYDDEPLDTYDFTQQSTQAQLENPGTVEFGFGYRYDDNAVESVLDVRHRLEGVEVSEDDLYATFITESFASLLDTKTFYGGRYEVGGISATELFHDIFGDVGFPERGWWNYIVGADSCVVSDETPLWAVADFSYYSVDPYFDDIMVDIPIPPVSHREALTMLAAYVGAYILPSVGGAVTIVPELPARVDKTLGEMEVYERPITINGQRIREVTGNLYSYNEGASETVVDADLVLPNTDAGQVVTITHDAVSGGSLTVTAGGTLVGTPTYTTYRTVFTVNPSATTIHVERTGNRVEIASRQFNKTYASAGESVGINCSIASDPTLTIAMYDHFKQVASSTSFEFSMRDNPAIEVGDKLYLQLMSERKFGDWNYYVGTAVVSDTIPLWTDLWSTVLPVVVTKARRLFNGGLDADYTVVVDIDP